MDEDPYQAPQAPRDNPRGRLLVGTPLLTALLLFIILPLLVLLLALEWLLLD